MPKALIVDDSWLLRNKLTKMAIAAGCEVEQAENGEDALNKLQQVQPDFILLDLLMPVMDGFHFLAELESRKITIPVTVVSADIQETTRQKVMKYNVLILNKPPKEDELKNAIETMLMRGE